MQTTEDERQYYLRIANDLDAMTLSLEPDKDADFLRHVIADVGRLERELRSVLPLYRDGGCTYCIRDDSLRSNRVHYLGDGREEKCLYHRAYAGTRALLGIPDEPAACVTCGKSGIM